MGPESSQQLMPVVVAGRVAETASIVTLRLRAADGSGLPGWSPGDHIDVKTPAGLRQYSLCGETGEAHWAIAVRRADSGRGGSQWLHDDVRPGARLEIGRPRSTFHLAPAERYLFLAAGIGITPLLPMFEQAMQNGSTASLIYSARRPGEHAFTGRLARHPGARLWTTACEGRFDIERLLERTPPETMIHACGPEAFLEAVIGAAAVQGRTAQVVVERFTARESSGLADRPFTIALARGGREVTVPIGVSALDALAAANVFVPSSCREGICGSCETGVLEGAVDHRDSILDDCERSRNDCFFPCVSRALSDHLIIDR